MMRKGQEPSHLQQQLPLQGLLCPNQALPVLPSGTKPGWKVYMGPKHLENESTWTSGSLSSW